MKTYTFHGRRSGCKWSAQLGLVWEASCSPISDDYTTDDIDAEDLLAEWVRYLERHKYAQDGWVPIYWCVRSTDGKPVFETAPFQPEYWNDNFLTHFSWPEDETGEPLNWLTLPVQDGRWKGRRMTKGGFIQEATGFKPAPLQDRLFLPTLLQASGLR